MVVSVPYTSSSSGSSPPVTYHAILILVVCMYEHYVCISVVLGVIGIHLLCSYIHPLIHSYLIHCQLLLSWLEAQRLQHLYHTYMIHTYICTSLHTTHHEMPLLSTSAANCYPTLIPGIYTGSPKYISVTNGYKLLSTS